MICPDCSEYRSAPPYKRYKNEQFNKKLEKMRMLIKSVDETSLKEEDKKLLKSKMKELF